MFTHKISQIHQFSFIIKESKKHISLITITHQQHSFYLKNYSGIYLKKIIRPVILGRLKCRMTCDAKFIHIGQPHFRYEGGKNQADMHQIVLGRCICVGCF